VDAQGHFMPVRGLGESGQNVLRRLFRRVARTSRA
jgi:hypothetical protein